MRKLIFSSVLFSLMALLIIQCKTKELKFTNHLTNASSPYLKEHADNPVDWYEWGEEALAKAKNENKPLIISIGYASCHWCHVMEEESFMDTTVARIMNEHFVAIKIDREERPDIDQIYINAAQLITGNAGWPLNAFALPDGRPFYAATYFPKAQWINVLNQIAKTYKNDHIELTRRAAAVTEGVQSDEWIELKIDKVPEFDRKSYGWIVNNWYPSLDPEKGGIKGNPKFPMPVMWEFLLQYHYLTGDPQALKVVQATLDEMSKGGINDQLAGGFARYSTDSMWRVPHFEKMLYDNAQLVSLYSHAYQLTKNPEYSNTVHQTLSFVEKELTNPAGGFFSSLNADSEGEEGKYYAWTKAEVENLLDKQSVSLIVDYYNLEVEGNWEKGKNVLFREFSLEDFSNKYGMGPGVCEGILNDARKVMLEYRGKRIPPSRDDKIITSWNALMLNGYVDAFLATDKPEYLGAALKNAKFLREKMMQTDGKLFRIYKDGKPSIDAFLDDYAQLAKAFIHLYQATLDLQWLENSRTLTTYAIAHFYDRSSGLFYYTSNLAPELVARKMELNDDVIPCSNSVMADNLMRQGSYYDLKEFIDMSEKMAAQLRKNTINGGPYFANWALNAGVLAYQPFEVAVMGPDALKLSREMQQHYLPVALFLGGDKENLPLLENKLVADATIIYVCRNKTCKLPVKNVENALAQMKIK